MQWESVGPAGLVTAVAMGGTDSLVLMATTGKTWILKSIDGGHKWEGIGNVIPAGDPAWMYSTSAVAIDPFDADVVYVGTGFDLTSGGIGIYRTTNGGGSWINKSTGIPAWSAVRSIVAHPSRRGLVLASVIGSDGRGRICRSVDFGETWSIMRDNVADPGVIYIDFADRAIAVMGSGEGTIYTSADTGSTWTTSPNAVTMGRISKTEKDRHSGTIYFSSYYNGLFRSKDGSTVERVNIGVDFSTADLNDFTVDQDSGTMYASVANTGVYRSTDGGTSWSCVFPSSDVWILYTHRGEVYVNTYTGFLRSSDQGITWVPAQERSGSAAVRAIAASKQHEGLVYAGAWGGVYRSRNGGDDWDLVLHTIGWVEQLVIDHTNDSIIYASMGGADERLMKTTDGGQTWTDKSTRAADSSAYPITSLDIQKDTATTLYAAGPGVAWKSTDGGDSWQILLLLNVHSTVLECTAIRAAHTNPATIYLGVRSSNPDVSGVFVTEDGGFNWTRRVEGIPYGIYASQISAVAVHPTNPSIAFAGASGYLIYKTTDGGKSWVGSFGGGGGVMGIDIDEQYPSHLIAVGRGGMLMVCSVETRDAYTLQLTGVYSPVLSCVAWQNGADGTTLYLGTDGGGVFRGRAVIFTGVPVGEDAASPTGFVLEQNYPNPFNPSTLIRYGLPQKSEVLLAVFNTLGQRVAILQNGEQEAGYHEAKFDGSDLPSGVYFYRMQAGSFVQARKLVLLR